MPGDLTRPPSERSRELVLQEWSKAENKARCAPIVFQEDMGEGVPRAARFAGGWAVAFDLPGNRSAFGIAGPGLTQLDEQSLGQQRARLARQWPVFREQPNLPQPAFVGYGVEGATRWPESNPNGEGLNSLAYLRIAGQTCTYNVWSRLGRRHLERLLDSLMMADAD